MFKNGYISKMYNLLIGATTYKKEINNLTNKIQNKINAMILSWFKKFFIKNNLKNILTYLLVSRHLILLYRLPKLLKENYPLNKIHN